MAMVGFHSVKRCVLPNCSEQAFKRAKVWDPTFEGCIEKYKQHCWRSALHQAKFDKTRWLKSHTLHAGDIDFL
jgi:hypothetical protein